MGICKRGNIKELAHGFPSSHSERIKENRRRGRTIMGRRRWVVFSRAGANGNLVKRATQGQIKRRARRFGAEDRKCHPKLEVGKAMPRKKVNRIFDVKRNTRTADISHSNGKKERYRSLAWATKKEGKYLIAARCQVEGNYLKKKFGTPPPQPTFGGWKSFGGKRGRSRTNSHQWRATLTSVGVTKK